MDWNHFKGGAAWKPEPVAPFTGSVDWNTSAWTLDGTLNSRSLHRERGLKYVTPLLCPRLFPSLPSQGAWIEMEHQGNINFAAVVAPFTGSVDWNKDALKDVKVEMGRSLHRERGLKFPVGKDGLMLDEVAPFTGSVDWNKRVCQLYIMTDVAPFTGSVDWNKKFWSFTRQMLRRSLHRERGLKWEALDKYGIKMSVAPFTGSVDWNTLEGIKAKNYDVAPFTGSVDWNGQIFGAGRKEAERRSLHRERGLKYLLKDAETATILSLPSQGAWIEIEGSGQRIQIVRRSLPSQGAWIEIEIAIKLHRQVASLPSQGAWIEMTTGAQHRATIWGRSLHRERGLKCLCNQLLIFHRCVAPFTGSVDWNISLINSGQIL